MPRHTTSKGDAELQAAAGIAADMRKGGDGTHGSSGVRAAGAEAAKHKLGAQALWAAGRPKDAMAGFTVKVLTS
jgi:hypothetical protein